MWLQAQSISDMPLGKMTAQSVAIILLVGLILWFLFKVVDVLHDTIKRLIDKRNGKDRRKK